MIKKIIFWTSLTGTVVYFLLVTYSYNLYDFCYSAGHCPSLFDSLDTIGPLIFLFPFVFVFSLITYFLREEVFRSWLHFAYWWLPLSVVLIWWAAGTSGGGFGMPNILDQETVAFVFSALFALISLLIIIIKSLILHFRR